jgi:hypothetical protein
MSSAKSVLFLFGLGALAANLAVACSATTDPLGFEELVDGGLEAALPESAPHPGPDGAVPSKPDSGGIVPPLADASPSPDASPVPDASMPDADAAASDAGPDAASADAGPPGSACPTKDAIQEQACGLCGTQSRLCAPNSAGSPNVWQPWGFCQNEVADGCVPGTATTEACGLCGTRNKVCQNDCRYAVGACKNEPAGACQPGAIDYQVGLSCDAGGRSRTCEATCTYGAFSDCFVQGEPTLTLATTAGGKVSGEFKLEDSSTISRPSGTCPVTSFSSVTPFTYVTLVNPTATSATVSVWSGQSSHVGASYIDTVIASYARDTKPVTDPERKACAKGVNDTCSSGGDPSACVSSWAGLVGSNVVTVPANGKIVIYVGAYYATGKGDFLLTARTDALN